MAPEFPVVSSVTLDKSLFSSLNQEIGPQAPKALLAETSQHREFMLTLLDPIYFQPTCGSAQHTSAPSSRICAHLLDAFKHKRQPVQTLAGDGRIYHAAIKRRMSYTEIP